MLALPQGADQYVVADLIVRAGVGLRLVPADVCGATIRGAVVRLLNDGTLRAGAERIRAEIEAMPDAAAAAAHIARYVSANAPLPTTLIASPENSSSISRVITR